MERNEWCCIYIDSEHTQQFIYGLILAVDDCFFAVNMIAPSGEYDGILVKPLHSIFRIETESQYCRKMKDLSHSLTKEMMPTIVFSDDIVISMLKFALKEKAVISLELNSSGYDDIVGIPYEICDNICSVYQYTAYGEYDGIAYVDIRTISQLCYNSSDERVICSLMNERAGDSAQGTVQRKRTEDDLPGGQGTVLCLEKQKDGGIIIKGDKNAETSSQKK